MRRFAQLLTQIRAADVPEQVAKLASYLNSCPVEDRMNVLALLSGHRPGRIATADTMLAWSAEIAGIPQWLVEESKEATGDALETAALLIPSQALTDSKPPGLAECLSTLADLRGSPAEVTKSVITGMWNRMQSADRYVLNKIAAGGFRYTLPHRVLTSAFAQHAGIDMHAIAQRLHGSKSIHVLAYPELLQDTSPAERAAMPLPFAPVSPMDAEVQNKLHPEDWQAELQWDGVRVQVVVNSDEVFVWTREGDLISNRVPELKALAATIPEGTILDCELIAVHGNTPLPVADLKKRLGKSKVTRKYTIDNPVVIVVFDVLVWKSKDMTDLPLRERRTIVEEIGAAHDGNVLLAITQAQDVDSVEGLDKFRGEARSMHCQGVVLKHRNSLYRQEGAWIKWPSDPLRINAVLLYVERDQGGVGATLVGFTFGVWYKQELVPIAKTNDGLTAPEKTELREWAKRNTVDRFGPVTVVEPSLVYAIEYSGVSRSARRKSGLLLHDVRVISKVNELTPDSAGSLIDLVCNLPPEDQNAYDAD